MAPAGMPWFCYQLMFINFVVWIFMLLIKYCLYLELLLQEILKCLIYYLGAFSKYLLCHAC